MQIGVNPKDLEAFAKEAAKGIKTEKYLDDFRKMLTKVTVEAALNAELDDHLGYGSMANLTRRTHAMVAGKARKHRSWRGLYRYPS